MAEPRTATPAGVAATKADVVLATKLHLNVPRAQPGLVSRPRLADLLEGALAGELMLVCAPAGFGKTALLSDWARRGGRVVAWLSLDAADSDPARFWRHVVAALDRARPGIAERMAPLLGPPAPSSLDRQAELVVVTTVVGPKPVVEAARPAPKAIWGRLAPHVNGAYANFLASHDMIHEPPELGPKGPLPKAFPPVESASANLS